MEEKELLRAATPHPLTEAEVQKRRQELLDQQARPGITCTICCNRAGDWCEECGSATCGQHPLEHDEDCPTGGLVKDNERLKANLREALDALRGLDLYLDFGQPMHGADACTGKACCGPPKDPTGINVAFARAYAVVKWNAPPDSASESLREARRLLGEARREFSWGGTVKGREFADRMDAFLGERERSENGKG